MYIPPWIAYTVVVLYIASPRLRSCFFTVRYCKQVHLSRGPLETNNLLKLIYCTCFYLSLKPITAIGVVYMCGSCRQSVRVVDRVVYVCSVRRPYSFWIYLLSGCRSRIYVHDDVIVASPWKGSPRACVSLVICDVILGKQNSDKCQLLVCRIVFITTEVSERCFQLWNINTMGQRKRTRRRSGVGCNC